MKSVGWNRFHYEAIKKGRAVYGTVMAFFCAWLFCVQDGFGQRIYADEVVGYSSPLSIPFSNCGTILNPQPCKKELVLNPEYARNDNGQHSTLLSSPGLSILGIEIGGYDGFLELEYPSVVASGVPTYIRVDGEESLFDALLGGTLGQLVGDVLGVVLGEQIIQVEVMGDQGEVVYDGDSEGGLLTDRIKMVRDADRRYYLRVVPDEAYKSIRITNKSSGLVGLGTEFELDVYHAFYFEDPCPYTTEFVSYDGGGVNLDALGLGRGGVQYPEGAIDGDLSTASMISPGLLNVLGGISQQFYFPESGYDTDEAMVTLSGNPSLLNLELFSQVSFAAYNGTEKVFEQDIGALSDELLEMIKLDLLGLLMDGEQVTFPVSPGQSFDRFEIRVGSLLDVDIGEAINIHEVERTIGKPSFGAIGSGMEVCQGENAVLSPESYAGTSLRWYDSREDGSYLGDDEFLVVNEVEESQVYYVSTVGECSGELESARTAVSIEVLKRPQVEDYDAFPQQIEYGESETVILEPAIEATSQWDAPQFSWSLSESGDPVITDEIVLDKGGHMVTYRVRPDGKLEIEGLVPNEDMDEVYLTLQNGGSECKVTKSVEQVFKILPVAWLYFGASQVEGGIRLYWVLDTDKPIKEMKVYRARRELDWEMIGGVDPGILNWGSQAFNYIDVAPKSGKNFYRIVVEYMDGQVEYSKVIREDMVRKDSGKDFKISPNPVQNNPVLHNLSTKAYKDVKVEVLDHKGIRVQEIHISQLAKNEAVVLQASQKLKPGIYIYSIITVDQYCRIRVLWR